MAVYNPGLRILSDCRLRQTKKKKKKLSDRVTLGGTLVEYDFILVYTGWPIKTERAYFPQYVDAITSISV